MYYKGKKINNKEALIRYLELVISYRFQVRYDSKIQQDMVHVQNLENVLI